MSLQANFEKVYRGRRVLVTGHTGFKGSWLVAWLQSLGATVMGYSVDIPTKPSLHETLANNTGIQDLRADIRDTVSLNKAFQAFAPEFVFHLAAQPLVRLSYQEPLETYSSNVMGTANVLEAIRKQPSIRSAVIVTTDKCYENKEWEFGYRENDRLGGADPYSSSKACSEILLQSYQLSFLKPEGRRVASARAGNVIGGGDWARDRIVPDCIRNWMAKESVKLRSPMAVRPWQHVLEPLAGYLLLGADLFNSAVNAGEAFNFGPTGDGRRTVQDLVSQLNRRIPSLQVELDPAKNQPKESQLLFLNCEKAEIRLGWKPRLSFTETIEMTADWYETFSSNPNAIKELTMNQIKRYSQA